MVLCAGRRVLPARAAAGAAAAGGEADRHQPAGVVQQGEHRGDHQVVGGHQARLQDS